ncbi:MAG: cell division topological specificity factor MinE [Oscillatoriales cyanobacterium CG2_30_44_21]|nr:MAG: cell division topological specificity factor MinE [Oscillatoriales cyanobacterium CG2_30_44_21]
MISTLLDRLFQRSNVPSGTKVRQRLKFILAHDRAAIEPQVFDNMRHEIMRVVSRYVELDEGSLDIRLESDKRMTALIANLPIRMVREQLPDLISLFDEPSDEEIGQRDSSALEMDLSAEAALDAIAAKEKTEVIGEKISQVTLESTETVEERTLEVANKLRTVANKSQSDQVNQPSTVIASNPSEPNPELVTAPVEEADLVDNSSQPTDPPCDDTQDQGDQLELSLDIPTSLEAQEVVIYPEQ